MNTEKTPKKGVQHSLRAIINAKCKECIYDPVSGIGNWKQQVESCTSYDCPIYPARPISKPKKVKS